MELVSLAGARALGLEFYYTGKPCKRGHIAKRRVIKRVCTVCEYEDSKRRRLADPEYHRAAVRAYQGKNPKKVAEWKAREYRRNVDRYRRSNLDWCAKNRERSREIKAAWQRRNPEAIRVKQTRRRARMKEAGGSHTVEDIRLLFKRQRGRCAGCSARLAEYHVDHITAIAKGGSNGPENLQLLCPMCNYSKHVKDPIEWAQENGRLL